MSARALSVIALVCSFLAAPIARADPYTIQAGDQLQVMVFGSQGSASLQAPGQASQLPTIAALSQTVTVLSDGTVTYPLIGPVSVAGLTTEDAAQRFSSALAFYVIRPTVTVLVEKGVPATVKVIGSVEHGGQFELQKGDRLADALAKAGAGPNSSADLNHITLNRVEDGVPHLYNINLYNMLLNADYSANPLLRPGDVVYVPKARRYDISNLVNLPFALYYLYLLFAPGITHAVIGPP